MSSVKLKHSSGNGTIINGPVANPSADITLKVPSTTGTAGQVLKVASANHSATNAELEWGTDPATKVLSVKHITTTNTFAEALTAGSTSTNNVLNLYFTASSTSNRLLVTMSLNVSCTTANRSVGMALFADGSIVTEAIGAESGSKNRVTAAATVNYTDNCEALNAQAWITPGSTSSINYSIRLINLHDSTNTPTVNYSGSESDTNRYPRLISTMTIMEVVP